MITLYSFSKRFGLKRKNFFDVRVISLDKEEYRFKIYFL